MRTLHVFFFVLATATLFAQTTIDNINCDTFPIQFGRVDAPEIPPSFAFVEAIDTRLPEEELGHIEMTLSRKCPVFNDVHKTLLNAFSPYWQTTNMQLDSVAVGLRSFYLSNKTNENGQYFTRVRGIIDFYKIENGNYYHIYSGKIDHFAYCRYTFMEFNAFMSKQLNRIVEDFTAFYNSYTFQAEQVIAGLKTEARTYDILNADSIKTGIYMSHADFVNNAPSIPIDDVRFFANQETKQVLSVNRFRAPHEVAANKNKFQRRIWGFASNNQVYINNRNYTRDDHFSRLDSIGYYIHFTGRQSANNATGGLLGLGGASNSIAGAAAGMLAGTIEVGPTINVDAEMVLNIETGKVIFISLYGMSKILKDDKDLIKALRAERKRNKMAVKKRYIQEANQRQLARLKEKEGLE